MGSTVRFVILDVFTDRPFAGNQLAVFTNATSLNAEQMQLLAREMNFSESTFVLPPEQGGHARVRIFTPQTELPFAGHPVLGTAFALGGPLQGVLVNLETGSGIVPVTLEREGARIVFGTMGQPAPSIQPYLHAAELLGVLGVKESGLPVELYDNGVPHVYVELPSDDAVAALDPDPRALAALGFMGVNCFAASGLHAKTRCFVPEVGVIEDAATGSAAGPLAYHLVRHGRLAYGDELEISQGAEIDRPSTLRARVSLAEDGETPVIEVGGQAVIVARGDFQF